MRSSPSWSVPPGETAMGRIMLEQQGVGFGIRQIVDRYEIEIVVFALKKRARHKASDASETIDCNFGRHVKSSC